MTAKQNISNTTMKATVIEMLYRKCFVFVLDLVRYSELLEEHKKHSVAKQLLETGTTLGLYMTEAKNTNNNDTFFKENIHLLKEAEKTKYWLQLCKFSQSYPNPKNLIQDIEELLEIISKLHIKTKK